MSDLLVELRLNLAADYFEHYSLQNAKAVGDYFSRDACGAPAVLELLVERPDAIWYCVGWREGCHRSAPGRRVAPVEAVSLSTKTGLC